MCEISGPSPANFRDEKKKTNFTENTCCSLISMTTGIAELCNVLILKELGIYQTPLFHFIGIELLFHSFDWKMLILNCHRWSSLFDVISHATEVP